MAPRRSRNGRAAEEAEWLPDEVAGTVDPATAAARRPRQSKPKPKRAKRPKKAGKASSRSASADRDLVERLSSLEDRLGARITELEKAVAKLSKPAAPAKAKTKAKSKPTAKRRAKPTAKSGGNRRRSRGRRGKPDVNEITYEELRELGLSTTQSARLIAARETRGGFGSLDELDGLRGFSAATLDDLKARVRLRT